MRKLIFEAYVSADGFATDKYGSTDFFNDVEFPDGALAKHQVASMEGIDTILLGADTYRMFAKFWPTPDADMEPMAEMINYTPKVVVSNSLSEAPWQRGNGVKIMPGEGIDSVRKLKAQPGGNIIIWGSLSLTHDLLRVGLIDEIRLMVVPVALGEGRPVFPVGEPPVDLTLIKAKYYPSGVVRQCYSVGKLGHQDDPESAIREIIAGRMRTVACPSPGDTPDGTTTPAVSFGVLPPLSSKLTPAQLIGSCQWMRSYPDPPVCTIQDMRVVVDGTVAFAHFLYCLSGKLYDGRPRETWIRCTICLEKRENDWAITHQHDSVPYDPETGLAVIEGRKES